MTQYHLRLAASAEDLARQVAEQVASQIDLALAQRDRCQIALAGGETPRAAYGRLGSEHLPWERVDVLLGDERWVSADNPASNARMIGETLLAQPTATRAAFLPVPTEESSPEASAVAYGKVLSDLFPGSPALAVVDRSVTVGEGKGLPRITLTAPVLSAARQVIFLVSGAGKRQALSRLLDPREPVERTPARLVRPIREVLILADAEAGAGFPEHVTA
jgi:6-phosphogluconolactonase